MKYKDKMLECIIDTKDLQKVSDFPNTWFGYYDRKRDSFVVYGHSYLGKKKQGSIYLSRYLMDCPDDLQVDHISRDRLDNRRSNLRNITQMQNSQNKRVYKTNKSCGIRGVTWYKSTNKWRAQYQVNKKKYHIGYFDTLEEADIAVQKVRAEKMPYSNELRKASGQPEQ